MPAILEKWEVMPHGPLVEIDDGILTVAGEIVMPLGRFPRRMTAVALAGGGTAIYSAIALDAPEMARIEAMGPPPILIAGNHSRLIHDEPPEDERRWRTPQPASFHGARASVLE